MQVVLRHPKVKLPIVVDTYGSGLVSREYADSGWEIDAKTSPEAALVESQTYESKPVAVTAKFAPAEPAAPAASNPPKEK
jgi:hypothetical protein